MELKYTEVQVILICCFCKKNSCPILIKVLCDEKDRLRKARNVKTFSFQKLVYELT